jgi:hypothetical protein
MRGVFSKEGDAKLVQAAPDLYEALEAMLAAYCDRSYAPGQQEAAEFDARAALAKARGQTLTDEVQK